MTKPEDEVWVPDGRGGIKAVPREEWEEAQQRDFRRAYPSTPADRWRAATARDLKRLEEEARIRWG